MPRYDGLDFNPPAPVAVVVLRDLANTSNVPNVVMLIDSGADVTLLPRRAVETLGVPMVAGETYELVGFDGTKSAAESVILELTLLDRTFRGRYLLMDAEQGILGRDVLNHFSLLLDGPGQQWSEYSTKI